METKQINSGLIFAPDGSLEPGQLEGLPQDLIDRISTPEFKARAARAIAEAKRKAQFEHDARVIRSLADQEHQQRRPSGVTGRQRKRLRKLARRVAQC